MKKLLVLNFLVLFYIANTIASDQNLKPRVIVMTDGEIDDRSSMVRFLLYTSDFDVEAIIETNSIFQRKGHSREDWYEKQLNAYEEIYPNLVKHNQDYPTPQRLREISFVGDEDEAHLKDLWWKNLFVKMVPGAPVTQKPDKWEDTPGSDRIVEVLLRDDPRPVYLQAWGGANTAARAFYKLKTQYPDEYEKAISKVVMYNIWYQDGAGTYIEQYHPKVTMIYCASFKGSWDYNSLPETKSFVDKHVKNNHGPLGALYPQDYISEGDSPSFFYNLARGLRNDESPTYGGWGGRFVKFEGAPNTFIDATENGDKLLSLKRWIEDINNDFEARMDWCVKGYDKANHQPKVKTKGDKNITIKSGKKLRFDAGKTKDPDGDEIKFKWWQYKEPGSFDGLVELETTNSKTVTFRAPRVSKPETIHLILEVSDNGSPSLKGYQRLIIEVVP